jgi:glutamyl-tRNA synthetase
VQKFDWERCGKGDGKFDASKLNAISAEHLRRPELTSDETFAASVLPFLEKRGVGEAEIDRRALSLAIPLVRPRAENLVDAADKLDYFFREPPAFDDKAVKKFLVADKATHLPALRAILASLDDFSKAAIEGAITAWLADKGLELKDVAQPARVALTGRSASPGLHEVLEVLGKERSLARLDRGIAIASGSSVAGA